MYALWLYFINDTFIFYYNFLITYKLYFVFWYIYSKSKSLNIWIIDTSNLPYQTLSVFLAQRVRYQNKIKVADFCIMRYWIEKNELYSFIIYNYFRSLKTNKGIFFVCKVEKFASTLCNLATLICITKVYKVNNNKILL